MVLIMKTLLVLIKDVEETFNTVSVMSDRVRSYNLHILKQEQGRRDEYNYIYR